MNKLNMLVVMLLMLSVSACSTSVAIVDVAASSVIYAGKTIVNTVDVVTPDIVN
jgi:hypothetical protein